MSIRSTILAVLFLLSASMSAHAGWSLACGNSTPHNTCQGPARTLIYLVDTQGSNIGFVMHSTANGAWSCTNVYGSGSSALKEATLLSTDPLFKEMYAQLLTAITMNASIKIYVTASSANCRITRVMMQTQ
jgi:hypothetical protein